MQAKAKSQAAETARKAELQAAADLGGGDSHWFEDYVDAATKIGSMSNVAPGENGIKTFFFELLSYDVPTLEQAIPGMETQLDGENAEAFKHVILVCKDLIARRQGGTPAAQGQASKVQEEDAKADEGEAKEEEMQSESKEVESEATEQTVAMEVDKEVIAVRA